MSRYQLIILSNSKKLYYIIKCNWIVCLTYHRYVNPSTFWAWKCSTIFGISYGNMLIRHTDMKVRVSLQFWQRCVVRGIALSSLLSCRLLANLNSRGSPVAPTWAHLCWPGSRSVHGSIHSYVIGRPRFARRGYPKHCLGCLAWSRRPPSVNESEQELTASGSNKLPWACQASQFRVGSPIEAL